MVKGEQRPLLDGEMVKFQLSGKRWMHLNTLGMVQKFLEGCRKTWSQR